MQRVLDNTPLLLHGAILPPLATSHLDDLSGSVHDFPLWTRSSASTEGHHVLPISLRPDGPRLTLTLGLGHSPQLRKIRNDDIKRWRRRSRAAYWVTEPWKSGELA